MNPRRARSRRHRYDLRGITDTLPSDDPAPGPDPVQGGHRRRGVEYAGRVGPAAVAGALQGRSTST
jgi:hypothetical protein